MKNNKLCKQPKHHVHLCLSGHAPVVCTPHHSHPIPRPPSPPLLPPLLSLLHEHLYEYPYEHPHECQYPRTLPQVPMQVPGAAAAVHTHPSHASVSDIQTTGRHHEWGCVGVGWRGGRWREGGQQLGGGARHAVVAGRQPVWCFEVWWGVVVM